MTKKHIGQLFIIGYQGEKPSYDFLSFVEEWGIGGIIIFARNLNDPEKLSEHIKIIEEASGQKIFTAIDQEGGLVLRVLNKGSLFPSAMGISSTGDLNLCEEIYYAIGSEMKNYGLNWNLAPVLDINQKDNPGIGARSFGETPEIVEKYGLKAIEGLRRAGVLACAKHFPGKGRAVVDSHLTLPIIPYSRDHLESFELSPFIKAMDAGVDAIMTSHVFFPAFEPTPNLPATLSRNVLTGLIREQFNYEGLIVTDDLEMGAITNSFGASKAADLAFHAGADLLLICHSLEEQRAAAEALYIKSLSNAETAKRLHESLPRIKKARDKISNLPITNCNQKDLLYKHGQLIELISEKSVKFLRYSKKILPIKHPEKTVFILPIISVLVKVEEAHESDGIIQLFGDFFPASKFIVYNPTSEAKTILESLKNQINNDSTIVFCSYNSHLFSGQTEVIKHLSRNNNSLILAALRNPYDILEHPQISTVVATFGFRTPAIVALLKVLSGKSAPCMGNWPIRV